MAKKLSKLKRPEEAMPEMEEMEMDFDMEAPEDDEMEFEMPEEEEEDFEEEAPPAEGSDPDALMDQLEEMGYDVSELRKQEPEDDMEEDMDLEEEEEGEL